jgi:hypothetical protein
LDDVEEGPPSIQMLSPVMSFESSGAKTSTFDDVFAFPPWVRERIDAPRGSLELARHSCLEVEPAITS